MKKIMLCCGSGASSGFLANNATAVAKSRGLSISVKACSESEVEDYMDEIDLVMVGPHFAHRLASLKDIADEYDVPVVLIDGDIYGSLDGNGLIDQALKSFKD